jgi:hypothetical protein
MGPPEFDSKFLSVLAVMGALIGLGQLLNSTEPLTWRYVFGRAICSAGLAASAPVALLWLPAMPPIAEFALAALIASLGTSGLMALIRRVTGGPYQ